MYEDNQEIENNQETEIPVEENTENADTEYDTNSEDELEEDLETSETTGLGNSYNDTKNELFEIEQQEETTAETLFSTPSGDIHVIHEISIGDIVTASILACLLIAKVLELIKR